jgi:hypothetical protein
VKNPLAVTPTASTPAPVVFPLIDPSLILPLPALIVPFPPIVPSPLEDFSTEIIDFALIVPPWKDEPEPEPEAEAERARGDGEEGVNID